MIYSFDLKIKLAKFIVFLLIIGNMVVGKPFASLRLEFLYVNEFLLAVLYLLFYKKNISYLFKIIILLTIPFYQILIKDYYFVDVLRDYALIYYPIIIYLTIGFDNKLLDITKELFDRLFLIIPYLPLIYLINKVLFDNLRFTEIVVFSLVFYFQEDTSKFKNYQKYIFYIFFFISVLQHRSSILTVVILFTFLYLKGKISKHDLIKILLSILIIFSLTSISNHLNILEIKKATEDVVEIFSPPSNCSEYYENNPKPELDYSKEEVCDWTNIEWRLTLWKAGFYHIFDNGNYLFRNTFGENIVQKLYNKRIIPQYMYYQNIENGLRNLHNSFLTLFYRIGLIPIFLVFFTFLYNLRNLKNYKWFMILILIQTFFDPILDGPVFSIPYFWILFYQIKKDMINLKKKID